MKRVTAWSTSTRYFIQVAIVDAKHHRALLFVHGRIEPMIVFCYVFFHSPLRSVVWGAIKIMIFSLVFIVDLPFPQYGRCWLYRSMAFVFSLLWLQSPVQNRFICHMHIHVVFYYQLNLECSTNRQIWGHSNEIETFRSKNEYTSSDSKKYWFFT